MSDEVKPVEVKPEEELIHGFKPKEWIKIQEEDLKRLSGWAKRMHSVLLLAGVVLIGTVVMVEHFVNRD